MREYHAGHKRDSRRPLAPCSFVAATHRWDRCSRWCWAPSTAAATSCSWLARLWSRVILGVPGVKLEVKMRAPLDPGRPYVFMPNHASMVDIWAMFVAIPASFRFIAKKQLSQHPAVRLGDERRDASSSSTARTPRRRGGAWTRRRAGSGRASRSSSSRRGRARATAGWAPFKKGGFHLAMDSGAAIVPVAITRVARGHAARRGADPSGHGRPRDRRADPDRGSRRATIATR